MRWTRWSLGALGNWWANLHLPVGGSSIDGILGQNQISARNVGQAKATTNKAASLVRGHLDIERILKDIETKAAANPRKKTVTAGSAVRKATGTVRRLSIRQRLGLDL